MMSIEVLLRRCCEYRNCLFGHISRNSCSAIESCFSAVPLCPAIKRVFVRILTRMYDCQQLYSKNQILRLHTSLLYDRLCKAARASGDMC